MTNEKLSEKLVGGSHDNSFQSRSEAEGVGNDGTALGNLHLDDDSVSGFGGCQSSGSRGTPTGQQWQAAPRENSLPAARNRRQRTFTATAKKTMLQNKSLLNFSH